MNLLIFLLKQVWEWILRRTSGTPGNVASECFQKGGTKCVILLLHQAYQSCHLKSFIGKTNPVFFQLDGEAADSGVLP